MQSLTAPRLVRIMIPHQAVDAVLLDLSPLLVKGDAVIDGRNPPYKESKRRAGRSEEGGRVSWLAAEEMFSSSAAMR